MTIQTNHPTSTSTELARRKRFCVSVMMADYYSAWLEADDEDHALELANARWTDQGDEGFHFDRSERLSIDVVDWEYVA